MCFSESHSYINAIALLVTALYVGDKYSLAITLIYFAIKDLIQGLLYKFIDNKKVNNFLTTLSWIHICFQPFVINLFFSYFSPDFKYWNHIFIICIIWGFYIMSTLRELDISTDYDCKKEKNYDDDFCAKDTLSYLGKYHLGYRFSRDLDEYIVYFYFVLSFLPALFTQARILVTMYIQLFGLLYLILYKQGYGERAATWCILSLLYLIPVTIFDKEILELINRN